MTFNSLLQFAAVLGVLLLLARPLGEYMGRVLEREAVFLDPLVKPLERGLYRLAGIEAEDRMDWKGYALAVLVFSGVGLVALLALFRTQHLLPFNPQRQPPLPWGVALNTALSFVTNTNWQAYAGESTMSHLTQMLGLTVQNFLSAAKGIAVLAALARGLRRRKATNLGSFWVDLTRITLYILLPLSMLFAVVLIALGVVQTLGPNPVATLLSPIQGVDGKPVLHQVLAVGPVASQEAIKILGTNGGGFFNSNSAHPFENPSALSSLLQVLGILLIPASLCFSFGRMVRDRRQGLALLSAMTLLFLMALGALHWAEQRGNPALRGLPVTQVLADQPGAEHPGGNLEGKESRFGITGTTLYATATTGTSCGAVNGMHDSFTPLGGLVTLLLMQLGEVVFGGVGSGLYTMLVFAILAVFMAGLMVGRTPEYLGKKIEAFETKMASLVILIPAASVLVGTALAVLLPAALASLSNPGAHGFSEALYAFSSASNNNGSAFAGLGANTPFYNSATGIAMLLGRFGTLLPVLAIAGSLASKKRTPPGPGTLPTHGPLFVVMLVAVVLLVGALTFLPALALGPIAEHLALRG
ncbi:MAG: potassium-transporting ATPase subunit KdpA [Acidobacteria bacterium]|nr:potassium-transporting ATPase subunit KdpA [Acidobacteriota bacterium]